jgi:uncharacterized protein
MQENGMSDSFQAPNSNNLMQQFLYCMRPVRLAMLVDGPTDQEVLILGEHFTYLSKLVEDGIVLMVGRTLSTDERSSFGIVVFAASSDEEARALMNSDPAIAQGLMEAELFPFTVALRSTK